MLESLSSASSQESFTRSLVRNSSFTSCSGGLRLTDGPSDLLCAAQSNLRDVAPQGNQRRWRMVDAARTLNSGKRQAASLQPLQDLAGADLKRVNALILEHMQSSVPLIPQVAEHIIAAGGKRLRPLLVLASARLVGVESDRPLGLAAAVEFIHTATLLHDDVVDESDLRRGRETANAMFGNAASVLVGDFLYSRAFQMMVGVGEMRVMEVLADATNIIAEGEVLQLLNCGNADVDVAAYLRVIHYKTAKLFEAAARLGAILGGMDQQTEEQMAAYGMHLGTAFQIVDDVLDYSSEEATTGKHLGDDLAEGKPTLPLILAMQNGTPEDAACIRQAIEKGDRTAFSDVLRIIGENGALDASREFARIEAQRAVEAISVLPPSLFREPLLELPSFAVERNY